MKKTSLITLILITMVIITSCSNKTNDTEDSYVPSEDDFLQYDIEEFFFGYDIDEEGNLYCTVSDPDSVETFINVFDPKGVLVDFFPASSLGQIILVDGEIYNIIQNVSNELWLEKFDKESNSTEAICHLTDYNSITKADATDSGIYFIGSNSNYTDVSYSLADNEDRFRYSGERVAYIDLTTGELEEVPIDLPVSMSATLDGNLVIYAYDQEEGYYFTIYDRKNKSFSDKIYHNLGRLPNFSIYNEDNDFIYLDVESTSFTIRATSLEPNQGRKDLVPNNLTSSHNIKVKGDFTYYTDQFSENISRIKNSAYLRGNKKITMLSQKYMNLYVPFNCGYNIEYEGTEDEKLSLLILSQDDNYDLYSMNSSQYMSGNIRDKGSFYPLNDVAGVEEYLDTCFPYIAEAATTPKGDIWMLPIYIDIPTYLYNDEICNENGINFSLDMDVDSFIDGLTKAKEDEELREMYFNIEEDIINDFINQYLRENPTFDTKFFRELAEVCKDRLNYIEDPYFGDSVLHQELQFSDKPNLLFYLRRTNSDQMLVSYNEVINAAPIPSITDNKTNLATCYFIAVNPASKNLKETLQYISSLSKYLAGDHSKIMAKDRSLYPSTKLVDDLYKIYENGEIVYTYPNEIFMDDFNKYLAGDIDIESFIKESDRRLDIYLNE